MDYQGSYFEDEERDGFFVPSIIKRCWACNLKLKEELTEVCNENGLNCSAIYGTMLGAVRAGGIIPWDDDIDMEMSRSDYEVLLEKSVNDKESDHILLDDIYYQRKIPEFVRRYTKYRGEFIMPEYWKEQYGFPFFSNIDIFIEDAVPREKRIWYINTLLFLMELFFDIKNQGNLDIRLYEERLQKAEHLLKTKLNRDSSILTQLIEKIDNLCKEFRNDPSDEKAVVSAWCFGDNYIFPNRLYDGAIEIPFEQSTICVPIGYDRILRNIFPGYMVPRADLDTHGYPYFDAWEKKMYQKLGIKLLRYEFQSGDLQKEKNRKKSMLQENLFSSVELLAEAHEFIRGHCQIEEMIPAVLDTLEQCQSLAVQMGEQIEQRVVSPEKLIYILEQYCEYIFNIYTHIVEKGETVVAQLDDLLKYEKNFRDNLLQEQEEKKEVVFLVYEVRYWKFLHSVWERAVSDKNTIVTVIPVPYYYRNSELELEKEMQLEMEGYPQEVILTPYDQYNFEVHCPDMVIYQFPYDAYSYALSWHPYFHIENIRKYTNKLVYIPHFVLKEIGENDEKAKYTLKWLIQTPGVINADEVFVQSDQMKKNWESLLEKFTAVSNGKSEINWNEHIHGIGSPLWDWESRRRVFYLDDESGKLYDAKACQTEAAPWDEIITMPKKWMNKIYQKVDVQRRECKRKKILLYYVNGSVLHEFGEKMIEKINYFIKMMEKYQDNVIVLWYQDPYAEEILKDRMPTVWKSYGNLLSQSEKFDYILIERKTDFERAVKICDAIYGDGGAVMTECRLKHKLVLFESPELSVERPWLEGERYERKKWTIDMTVAVEGEWSLENLIQEMQEYNYEVPEKDCGDRIWNYLSQK